MTQLGALAIGAIALMALGQAVLGASAHAQGIPNDWTHRQIVFSNPGAAPPASNPAAFARWSKIVNDPRFKVQAREFAARATLARQNAMMAVTESANFRRIGPPRRAPAQRDWSMNMVTGASGSAANGVQRYPAKYSFDAGTTPFCDDAANPDFVVYATGTGATGVADIIAYDNLYKAPTCSGSVPMVYFQYSVGGTVPSSPVFSLDGSQMAFINVNGTIASLMLIKWAKNPSLVPLTATPAANYRSCAAPCMTTITLNGSPNSTGSSVFYDYNSDAIYVGDNSGRVHKFINVFLSGTPSEITGGGTGSGWPQTLHTGAMPSGVLDPVSNYFIVGTGTRVTRIPAGGGSANIIRTAALRTACGFLSPPVVDIVAGRAYFTLSDYNGTTTVGTCGAATGGPAIVEVSTTFANTSAPIAVLQLPNGTTRNVNISSSFGNFDYSYYNSSDPGNPSGKFYACLYGPNPKLVQFTITNNVLTSFINGPNIATATSGSPQPSCTPIVEFFDGATDRIFTGVYTGQATTAGTYNCGNLTGTAVGSGCVISYNVTQPFTFSAATTPQAVLPVAGGGASGIVIDNRASGGGSQVYFQSIMPQACGGNGTIGAGTGWCAIQASQNGLN